MLWRIVLRSRPRSRLNRSDLALVAMVGLAKGECIVSDVDTTQVLCFILEELKHQAIFARRLHGWVIAVAETIEKNPDLEPQLKRHPFYDQGFDSSLPKTDLLLSNIDALIRQLREPL